MSINVGESDKEFFMVKGLGFDNKRVIEGRLNEIPVSDRYDMVYVDMIRGAMVTLKEKYPIDLVVRIVVDLLLQTFPDITRIDVRRKEERKG